MGSPNISSPFPHHLYGCIKCKSDFIVFRGDPDINLLKIEMPCPTSGCSATMEVGHGGGGDSPKIVTAEELFYACSGLGFQHERGASPSLILGALVGATIFDVDVDKERSSSERSVVSSIAVESDVQRCRAHLSTSRYGAVIYRITPEKYE